MEHLKVIATISLFIFIASCGSVKRENPYRPSGKTIKKVSAESKKSNRQKKISFLQDRYNLCTHKRALRSAKYEYKKIIAREKRFGNKLTNEKNKYRKIIIEIGERTRKEELKFKKTYRRRLYCTNEEMRYLNL